MARDVIKAHEAPATPEEMEAWREKHDAFVSGKLPLSQARAFMKRARETMPQRQLRNSAVGYLDAKRVYNVASRPMRRNPSITSSGRSACGY
jgi:hypothetical protein